MSNNASNRTAAQREREKRAAAKAKRQAAKAVPGAGIEPDGPIAVPGEQSPAARTPAPSTASSVGRKESKGATLAVNPDVSALPLGDQHGTVATLLMLAVLALLALLVIAVAAAT